MTHDLKEELHEHFAIKIRRGCYRRQASHFLNLLNSMLHGRGELRSCQQLCLTIVSVNPQGQWETLFRTFQSLTRGLHPLMSTAKESNTGNPVSPLSLRLCWGHILGLRPLHIESTIIFAGQHHSSEMVMTSDTSLFWKAFELLIPRILLETLSMPTPDMNTNDSVGIITLWNPDPVPNVWEQPKSGPNLRWMP